MGLFKSRKNAAAVPIRSARDPIDIARLPHTFWLPCTGTEAAQAFMNYGMARPGQLGKLGRWIGAYVETYGNNLGVEATAPVAGGVYVEIITPDLIRIRAGNRVEEFWRIDIDLLTEAGESCTGTARLIGGGANGAPTHWAFDATDAFLGIMGTVMQAGGRLDSFPLGS